MLLGVLTLLSLSSGIVFVNFGVILRIVLMIKIAFFVYFIMLLLGPMGMVRSIFLFSLLMNLVFSGILNRLVGLGLVFLLLRMMTGA